MQGVFAVETTLFIAYHLIGPTVRNTSTQTYWPGEDEIIPGLQESMRFWRNYVSEEKGSDDGIP